MARVRTGFIPSTSNISDANACAGNALHFCCFLGTLYISLIINVSVVAQSRCIGFRAVDNRGGRTLLVKDDRTVVDATDSFYCPKCTKKYESLHHVFTSAELLALARGGEGLPAVESSRVSLRCLLLNVC